MKRRLRVLIAVAIHALLAITSWSASAAELAPTGVLRATYNSLNSGDARFDRRTQMIVGPTADLTRELARRLNLPFEITGVDGTPAVVERVKTRRSDIGFVPCEAAAGADVDASQPYALVRGAGQCIVVPKGGMTGIQIINRFIDEARASGKLRQIVER